MPRGNKMKWTGSLLAVAIATGVMLPYNVLAQEVQASATVSAQASQATKITKEEAIQIAKSVISIPDTYTNSQVELENNKYLGRAVWRLYWNLDRPGDDYGSITVSIDANDGTIMNIDYWSREMERNNVLPAKLDTGKLLKEANDFIKKNYGKYANELKVDPDSLESFTRGNTPYMANSLYFARQHDGIPVNDQGLRIMYDKKGKLRGLHFNWDSLQFESRSGVKSEAEILREVGQSLELELAFLPNLSRPGGKIELAYAPKLKSVNDVYSVVPNLLIDAKTGKQISGMNGREVSSLPSVDTPLSKEKISVPEVKLDEAGAIAKVKELGLEDSSMEIQQKNYREEGEPYKRNVWDIQWRGKDGLNKYMQTSFDAHTGELIGFYRYGMQYEMKMQDPQKIKVNVTADQAQKKAEAFVRKAAPGKLNKLYMVEAVPSYVNGDENKVISYEVSFVRKENGIRVVGEGVFVTVDAENGDITNYNMNWSKLDFPSANNVMKVEEAKEKVLSLLKADLRYNVFPAYNPIPTNQPRKAKPVYSLTVKAAGRPAEFGNTSYLDARTGEWKAYGNQVVNNGQPVTDIAGHVWQKELQEMIDSNLLEVKDGKVNPDQKLARAELVQVLYIAAGQPYDFYVPQQSSFFNDVKDDSEYKTAVLWALQNRLLSREESSFRPNEPATREFLAELIVRGLGYGKLAAREGVFDTKFADEESIKKKGYAALVNRLNIMEINAKKQFEPNRQVTKAEAAVAVYRYLQAKESFME
jgi:hypothetical protein